jgi:hypothetical protein
MPADKKAEIPKFLAGWKEIAQYLGKGVRTVQRYEREMGLPVRRPAAKSRAAVVATRVELDAWVTASPLRQVFSLPRMAYEGSPVTKALTTEVAEMTRLRLQMAGLRDDLRHAVTLLAQSVEIARSEVSSHQRSARLFSVADFDLRNKAVFDLLGTQTGRKAN